MAGSKLTAEEREFFREQGRRGGKLSGAARMKKLTPEQRSAIAKNAVAEREARRRIKRYGWVLPPADALRRRIVLLTQGEQYFLHRVALQGVDPAALAEVWHMSEAEIFRRVQEAIRKLRA